ncbi:hypothetical protein ABES02_02870 [Neobacillus pocheonensis]|uniref:hypothetical protein n=1 Tax=Neobacillus pocheonensis TaxID=363869 RepID=UPI003D2B2109
MIYRVAAVSYHFTLELMLTVLCVFLFFIQKNELPPIFVFLGICLFGIILFTMLLSKFLNKGKWLYFITIFPLLLMAGQLLGFSLLFSAMSGLFIFWRGISLFDDYSEHSEVLMVLLSFLIGLVVIIYSAMRHYSYQNQIVFFLIFEVFLVVTAAFIKKWNVIHSDRWRFAQYFIKILSVLSLIGLILTSLFKYLQTVVFSILQFIVIGLSSIVEPMINILQYLLNNFSKKEFKSTLKESDVKLDGDNFHEHSFGITENILYHLLIMAVVGFIIFLFYKRKLKFRKILGSSLANVEITNGVLSALQPSFMRKRVKPPNDFIRREIFELQKLAHKLHLERLPHETLEEWWNRIGIPSSGDIIQIYEKVRYGEVVSSIEEIAKVKVDFRVVRQYFKDIHNK